MNWRDRIHSNPDILGGKPVVKGTRISVKPVLEYLAEGAAIGDLLAAYPHLAEVGVRAALAFAHDLLVDEASAACRQAA